MHTTQTAQAKTTHHRWECKTKEKALGGMSLAERARSWVNGTVSVLSSAYMPMSAYSHTFNGDTAMSHRTFPTPSASSPHGEGGLICVQGRQHNHNEKYTQRTLYSHRDRVPDAAHLVGGQAEVFPGVFFRDIGDAQGLVKVLKLGLVRREVPTFLVPCNVWCWASQGTKEETKGLLLNVALVFERARYPDTLKVNLGPRGRCILSKSWAFLNRESCLATGSPQKDRANIPCDQYAQSLPFPFPQSRDGHSGVRMTDMQCSAHGAACFPLPAYWCACKCAD